MIDIFNTLIEKLHDPNTSWSIGTFGAIAEFHRDAKEEAELSFSADSGRVVTKRGAIQIERHTETRLIPYETVSKIPSAWSQGVMVCLPSNKARLDSCKGVTDLGPDDNALLPTNDERLFDMDFEFSHFNGCIRTANSVLWDALAASKNLPFLQLSNETIQTLKGFNPVRVFRSRLARIEVAEAIPDSQGVTPVGPHTHILPNLLRRKREQAANIPIPDGFTAALAFYPPHPARNIDGTLKAFDRPTFDAFQRLIDEYALPELASAKHKAWELLDLDATANIDTVPKTRHARMAFRVALRQWEHINGPSSVSAEWRNLCDPTNKGEEENAI